MTLSGFVVRNTFRNKRRSLLTMVSISFSLLLLTLMMSIWRTFYIDQGPPNTAKTIITRDRVSLAFFLPAYYRDKIRSVPGVVAVAPMTYFGNVYKDDRATNSFAQAATDPDEYPKVAPDKIVPPEQLLAWQRDRTGAMVDVELAKRFGWKIGDHLVLQSPYFPVHPEVTIRAMYTVDPPARALYFSSKYLEESVSWFKGQAGWYITQVATPGDVAPVSKAIDEMFRNSPQRTKTESQQAFRLSFISSLGNVKAFILGICGAVVFAILLVSCNTMAMSIRARTREVAVLKALGFTRQRVLSMFVGESIALSLAGGVLGVLGAALIIRGLTHSPAAIGIPADMSVTFPTMVLSLLVAASVGFVSGCLPAYGASRTNIVEGLRHIG
ncbi:MAG TPA: FtsX-like permease family protein [Candidatus Sulfotelmatobacter sp.]|jgi:putative ABC transport system permease protein|nr:FtsX-like permease family protein [Candidatus Sulfotelmatobacter sp.]